MTFAANHFGLRNLASRFVRGYPESWLAIAIGLMALFALVIWVAVTLFIWLWDLASIFSETMAGPDVRASIVTYLI